MDSEPEKLQLERDLWFGNLGSLVAGTNIVIGLVDVWLFPNLVFENGGGAFFIPYLCSIFCVGYPLILLEMSLGQFSSSGSSTCWGFCPLVAGCGISMAIILTISSIYYIILVSWGIYYLFISLSGELPWDKCGSWSSSKCVSKDHILTKEQCIERKMLPKMNGICINVNRPADLWIWSEETATRSGIIFTRSVYEYFERVVVGHGNPREVSINTPIVMSLALAWLVVWIFTIRGIRFSETIWKITLVLSASRYILMMILLVRGLMLDGSEEGVLYFIFPDVDDMFTIKIWHAGAQHVFFSLAVSYGCFITMGSYNKFHHDTVRDVLLLPLASVFISFIAGIVIFSHVGFEAKNRGIGVNELTLKDQFLVFELIPFATSQLPYPTLWNILLFLMIVIIGLTTQSILVEMVISIVMDYSPRIRMKKSSLVTGMCLLFFIFGLPMTTPRGLKIFQILYDSSNGCPLLFTGIVECLAVGWFYGADRFIKDIEIMIGNRCCMCFRFSRSSKKWWKFCWKLLTPGCLILLLLAEISHIIHDTPEMPAMSLAIDVCISFLCTGSIFGVAIYHLMNNSGTLQERWQASITPTPGWGPARAEDRARAFAKRYVPDFVANLTALTTENQIPQSVTDIAESAGAKDNDSQLDKQKDVERIDNHQGSEIF